MITLLLFRSSPELFFSLFVREFDDQTRKMMEEMIECAWKNVNGVYCNVASCVRCTIHTSICFNNSCHYGLYYAYTLYLVVTMMLFNDLTIMCYYYAIQNNSGMLLRSLMNIVDVQKRKRFENVN